MYELRDTYNRTLNYVRISVTDRCNFRCLYCMPAEGVICKKHSEIMRYEDIMFLCTVLSKLGVKKFRFTGGEPLVRKGLVDFLGELHNELPDVAITITTNGALLEEHAEGLAKAGIKSINVSLDTLDSKKFSYVTRIGTINNVISGIDTAASKGIKIKLNSVLIRNFNDSESDKLIEFARNKNMLLRFIEFMPLQDSIWNKDSFLSGDELFAALPFGGTWNKLKRESIDSGPAQYYQNSITGDKVGIITAVSNHFCKNCNRLRISSNGHLRNCLFNPDETDLSEILHARDKQALIETILHCVNKKPRCWDDINTGKLKMSEIGG